MNLYPYQQVGAKFLAERKYALLADEPGLGKTAQAIAACRKHNARFVTVVCPASAVENWRREFVRFWPGHHYVFVRSYDRITRTGFPHKTVGHLILDESHYLKSRKAKRTKAIFGKGGLAHKAERVYCLSGTPAPNHPAEVWPMLHALAPDTIKGRNGKPRDYWSFVRRYCETRSNGFGEVIVGGKNLAELKANLEPFMLRRKKADVLTDLPPIVFDEVPLSSEAARKALRQVEDTDEGKALAKALADGVDGLGKLAGHFATLRRLTGVAKAPAVAEMLKDEIEGGLRKVVVFAHHTAVLQALEAAFTGAGIKCVGISGATPAGRRQAMVDTFQTDPEYKVFLGQITAAGTAITLTAASDVVFAESSWVPADNSQAAMRCHRIGQTRGVLVRFATLAGSIDERVQRAVARKTATITELMG